MLTLSQLKQLTELVNDADIDAVNEYIGLLLEDIAGFECITDDELLKIQAGVLSGLKNR
jgi:hypothetical protein